MHAYEVEVYSYQVYAHKDKQYASPISGEILAFVRKHTYVVPYLGAVCGAKSGAR
jgi:hypothetical protein